METRLICGDREGKGPSAEAWRSIPDAQAEFHFRTFMQDRGFYRSRASREGDRLWLDSGQATRVTALRTEGAPPELDLGRRRKVVGELLTPKLLDETEQWVKARLQFEGYACPEVKASADAAEGGITVRVEPGFRQNLVAIVERDSGGLAPGMLRRYDAFRLGDRFNAEWLTLSSRRVAAQGLMDNVYYTPTCSPTGVTVTQEAIAGPPRLLSAGIGVNTESGPLARLSWKNSRLGRAGSSIDVTLRGSFREQSLMSSMSWFFLRDPSRIYIKPAGEVRHRNERFFEELSARAMVAAATSHDDDRRGISARVGPAIDYFGTIRGDGPRTSKLVSLDAEARVTSHAWELFQASPRTGYFLVASAILNSRKVLSDVSARRVRLFGQWLWNVREHDPPLWVLGVRGALASTFTEGRLGADTRLPPSLRDYLGGSLDLRGFGRKELPGPDGGLTSAFVSLEARLVATLWLGLEPFVFLDVGALGAEPGTLNAPVFWSPGTGIRWGSPIGTVRATVAHGYAGGGPPSHLQIYFSLGEEF